MDRGLRELLEECLREVRAPSDIEGLLRRHPNRAEEMRPYLETAVALRSEQLPGPSSFAQARGREKLLSRLAAKDGGKGRTTLFGHSLMRAGTLAAGALFMLGGIAGASAAAGGPDLASPLVNAVTGINHAPDNADNGKDHANPNAFEGSENSGQGINNASETGQKHANSNASEGADNAGQGIGNASETGQQHPTPTPTEGAGNSEGGIDTANGHAPNPVPSPGVPPAR